MTKQAIDKLKPGDQLRIKRGYDNAGKYVTFLELSEVVVCNGWTIRYLKISDEYGEEAIAPAERFTT